MNGILLEIRAFDTSFFDVFLENEKIVKELSENFKGHLEQDNKYTWNDRVSIKEESPKEYHPGELAIVCGMSKIIFESIAKKFDSKVGDWIYTVEIEDGSIIHVAEHCIEKDSG